MNSSPLQQAVNLIQRSQKILLLSSSPPDGDSLGSALALYLFLKKYDAKKEITAVCADPVPDVYQFLPKDEVIKDNFVASRDFIVTLESPKAEVKKVDYQIENNKVNIVITPRKGNYTEKNVTFSHGVGKYDLIVVLDAGDLEQLGALYEDHIDFFFSVPVINLDHHASNTNFGQVNLVDITASSTTEILYQALKELDQGKGLIDEDIATALLAGIITDTGSFQNANTTPKALAVSAELVNLGARQQEIIKHVYKTKHLSTLKLWGRVLSRIKNDPTYRIVWSLISQEDLIDTESLPEETGNIIDELMTNTPGAEIILLLKEKKPGLVKGSLRTTTASCDASKIADLFGGGGHVQAAGFKVEGKSLEEAENFIIKKIKDFQAKRLPVIREGLENGAIAAESSSVPKTSAEPEAPVAEEPPIAPEPPAALGPPAAPEPPVAPEATTETKPAAAEELTVSSESPTPPAAAASPVSSESAVTSAEPEALIEPEPLIHPGPPSEPDTSIEPEPEPESPLSSTEPTVPTEPESPPKPIFEPGTLPKTTETPSEPAPDDAISGIPVPAPSDAPEISHEELARKFFAKDPEPSEKPTAKTDTVFDAPLITESPETTSSPKPASTSDPAPPIIIHDPEPESIKSEPTQPKPDSPAKTPIVPPPTDDKSVNQILSEAVKDEIPSASYQFGAPSENSKTEKKPESTEKFETEKKTAEDSSAIEPPENSDLDLQPPDSSETPEEPPDFASPIL